MKVCLDVDYREDCAVTACVGFDAWEQSAASFERATISALKPGDYQSGEFYKRELPFLLEAIGALPSVPELVVVDAYVWLGPGRPGLGAKLHEALGGKVPVVGVAKRRFVNSGALEVRRGASTQPLYGSAAGVAVERAAQWVKQMHGEHRLPTLLKRVDRLCRDTQVS
ncbi:MAG: endonuclease V [Myxococcaceae bacterium]